MAISMEFDFNCPFLTNDEDENLTDLNLGDKVLLDNIEKIKLEFENENEAISEEIVDDDFTLLKMDTDTQTDLSNDWSKIWELIQCPICFEQVKPPVALCVSGHHICSECWKQVPSCSICRCPKSEVRCILLENILTEIPFPCLNKEAGCLAILSAKDIDSHVKICMFRKYKCPVKDCTIKLAFDDFSIHLMEVHCLTSHVINDEKKDEPNITQIRLKMKDNFLGYFVPEISKDVIFFLHYKKEDDRYYFWVSYSSSKKRSSNEKFKLVLNSATKSKAKSTNGDILALDDPSIFDNDNFLEVTEKFFKNLVSPYLTLKIKRDNSSKNFVKQEILLIIE